MPIPQNKEELIKAITDNYTKLKTEFISIPENKASIKDLEGHAKDTNMSVKNLLSYLIGWGQLVLKWEAKKSKGLQVDFPETGYKWNELGLLAQKFYKDYEKNSFSELQAELKKTTNAILKLIESKSNQELYGVDWYEKYTLGRMIQLNTSSPLNNAGNRIRKWRKQATLKK